MRLIYLGSPYTDSDEAVRASRVEEVQKALAYFANNAPNLCLYSPIAHWSGVADKYELPHNFSFWLQQDLHMIRLSTALWILTIEGWKKSYGLQQEREFAESINKPVLFVVPNEFGFHITRNAPTE